MPTNLSQMTPENLPDHTPKQPAPPELRPLGVGEILDAAFRLLRQNLGTYLKVALLFLTIPVLVTALYMISQIVLISGGFVFVDDPDSYNVFVFALTMLIVLAQLLGFGVLVHLSTRLYMNYSETAGSIVKASRSRLAAFVGMSVLLLLYAVAVFFVAALTTSPFSWIGVIGFLAIVIAWATYYSLTAPAFWYEKARAGEAIGRSAALVRKRFWQVFWSLFVGFVIVGVFRFGLTALAEGFVNDIESVIPYVLSVLGLEYVGSVISVVALAPIVTVVYFDGRVRNEGFDMKLRLDETRDSQPPPPVPW